MQNANEIKEIVKEKYGQIAKQSGSCCGPTSCCGSEGNGADSYSVIKDDYAGLSGYVAEADLGLGCGLPTQFAGIKEGDTVVDLGSGAGNDVFVARAIVGESGKVIGIDMTEAMIEKAKFNNLKLGFNNVEFKLGEIENIPLDNNIANVIVSNCVLNLVPDKPKAFAEIFRITKPGGHFCVSDIVIKGDLPEKIRKSSEMYVGCVAGAVSQEEYLTIIKEAGFKNIEIKKSKRNDLPLETLKELLTESEIEIYRKSGSGIYSITVTADKI